MLLKPLTIILALLLLQNPVRAEEDPVRMNAEKRYEEFEVNDWFEDEAVKAKLRP